MNEEKQLTVVEENEALPYLGMPIDRELIVHFGDTLMGVHPQAKEIGKIGMRTIAQLAMVTGANPLPGTNGIHAWVDSKGKLCFQFGIGYWRGEAERKGQGVLWVERPRQMSDDERSMYGLRDTERGSICLGALRSDVIGLMREMREFGIEISFTEAKNEVAKIGVGVVGTETWGGGNYKEQKTGRPLQWTADERAERDLLRKLVPITQHGTGNGGRDWSVPNFVKLSEINEQPEPKEGDTPVSDVNDLFFDGEFEEVEETAVSAPEPAQTPESETVTEQQTHDGTDWRKSAMSCVTLKNFAEIVVNAGIGYEKVPHVINALTKTWAEENEAQFVFPTRDERKRGEYYDWLVGRKK